MATSIFTNYRAWLDEQVMPKGKRAVLIAGLDLFSQRGFDGTSTAEIATKAGVSQGTIFKYFTTKNDLLLAIVTPTPQNIGPLLRDDFFDQLAGHTTLVDLIHVIVQDRWQFLKTNWSVIRIILTQTVTNPRFRRETLQFIRLAEPQLSQSPLADIISRGEVHADLTLVDVMRSILSQLLSYAVQRQLTPQGQPNEKTDLEKLDGIIIRGLQADGLTVKWQ